MAYITINKIIFFNNLDYFVTLVGNKDKLSIALKDNAYGHGIDEIANLCSEYGIKNVFVKNLKEAEIIKKYNFCSVQVLYDIPKKLTNFSISINSLENLEQIPKGSTIELKIDTGMHRNGIEENEIYKALEFIKAKELILKGVFSHFCCADENNDETNKQEILFLKIVEDIKRLYNKKFNIHIANTLGSHRVDNSIYDQARIGIGVYGYLDVKYIEHTLKPILALYANKISTRILNKNEHIGYGSKAYLVPHDKFKVSNYDIGYGDGFVRISEDKKFTIKNGKEILGRVSMDSLSINGDDDVICIFDNVSSLAEIDKTIEYEILSQLSPFLKRVII